MKNKFWFRSFLSVFFLAALALVLIACDDTPQGPTDEEIVATAKTALNVTFTVSGDTASAVTGNLALPTTQGDVSVTWSSSAPAVISNTGVVTRPEVNTQVVLTATLTLNDASDTKAFNLTVIAAEVDPLDALDAIELGFATGDTAAGVTQNVTLPATSLGLEIEWVSPNTAVLSNSGVVTRPAYGQNNVTVVLRAEIGDETKSFPLVILAITEKPVALKLSDAHDALFLDLGNGIATSIALPAVAGAAEDGVVVTWSSSNPAALTISGSTANPNRGATHVPVTLTATLSVPGSDETLTKEFEGIVLALVDYEMAESIDDAIAFALAQDALPANEKTVPYMMVPGITVVGKNKDGFMIADQEGTLAFVFTLDMTTHFAWQQAQVGSVYDIIGLLSYFNGGWQFDGNGDNSRPIVLTDSEETAYELVPTVVAKITDLIPDTEPVLSRENYLVHEYIQLTAKVILQDAPGNYDTFLVDPDYTGGALDVGAGSPYEADGVVVYYQSNKDALAPFDGLTITLNVFIYSLRNDRHIYTVIFTETAEDITIAEIPDADLVDLVGASLATSTPAAIIEAGTINLPATLLGATIAWSSDNQDVINATTGAVTPVEGERTIVKLTATVTKGAVTKPFEFNIAVGELAVTDLSDAIALPAQTLVKVEATVMSMSGNRAFILRDDTGAIAVFVATNDVNAWLSHIGKVVTLEGTISIFNGLVQINPTVVTVKSDTGGEYEPIDINDLALTAQALLPYQSMQLSRSGMEVVSSSADGNGNITMVFKDPTTEETIQLRWDSRSLFDGLTKEQITAHLQSFAVGSLVDFVGIPLGWFNAPQLGLGALSNIIVHVDEPTTDTEKVDSAGAALNIPEQTTAASITLPTTGLWETTIAWASSNPAVISTTGTVTVPTGNAVTVTLTATISLGDVDKDFTFDVVVGIPVSDILDVYSVDNGTVVRIQGIVTGLTVSDNFTNGHLFLQDDTAGIVAFRMAKDVILTLAVGDEVILQGTKEVGNGLVRLAAGATIVEIVSSENTVEPVVVTTAAELVDLKGQLVSVTGYLKNAITTVAYGTNYMIVLADGTEVVARSVSDNDSTDGALAALAELNGLAAGTQVTIVTGVDFFNSPQLALYATADITVGAVGDTATLGSLAMLALVLPEASAELTTNLALPTTGLFGLEVVWTSSLPGVISETGVVVRGETDTEVTLSYVASIGETEIEADSIVFTVLAAEDGEPEPLDGTLMIFEVYGGGGNSGAYFKYDFVVLYNGTADSINLSTYTLQYASATGAFGNNTSALSGTIASGDYFVIQLAAGTGGTADLPQVDLVAPNALALSGTNGKIALVSNSEGITGPSDPDVVDFVGFGTATTYEGEGSTPAPSNSTSVRRIVVAGVPQDTNDNSVDFVVKAADATVGFDYLA